MAPQRRGPLARSNTGVVTSLAAALLVAGIVDGVAVADSNIRPFALSDVTIASHTAMVSNVQHGIRSQLAPSPSLFLALRPRLTPLVPIKASSQRKPAQ